MNCSSLRTATSGIGTTPARHRRTVRSSRTITVSAKDRSDSPDFATACSSSSRASVIWRRAVVANTKRRNSRGKLGFRARIVLQGILPFRLTEAECAHLCRCLSASRFACLPSAVGAGVGRPVPTTFENRVVAHRGVSYFVPGCIALTRYSIGAYAPTHNRQHYYNFVINRRMRNAS